MISTAMKYMTSSAFFVSYLEKLSIKHLEKKERFKKQIEILVVKMMLNPGRIRFCPAGQRSSS